MKQCPAPDTHNDYLDVGEIGLFSATQSLVWVDERAAF